MSEEGVHRRELRYQRQVNRGERTRDGKADGDDTHKLKIPGSVGNSSGVSHNPPHRKASTPDTHPTARHECDAALLLNQPPALADKRHNEVLPPLTAEDHVHRGVFDNSDFDRKRPSVSNAGQVREAGDGGGGEEGES